MENREHDGSSTGGGGGGEPSTAATTTTPTSQQQPSAACAGDLQSEVAAEFSYSRPAGRSSAFAGGSAQAAAANLSGGSGGPTSKHRQSDAVGEQPQRKAGGAPGAAGKSSERSHAPSSTHAGQSTGARLGGQGNNPSVRVAPFNAGPPHSVQSRGRISSLLAGAGPLPRGGSPDVQGPSARVGARAYTPPNQLPALPAEVPRTKTTHRRLSAEGSRTLATMVGMSGGGERGAGGGGGGGGGEGARFAVGPPQAQAPAVPRPPRVAGHQHFYSAVARGASPTVFPGLDDDFQAARDLASQGFSAAPHTQQQSQAGRPTHHGGAPTGRVAEDEENHDGAGGDVDMTDVADGQSFDLPVGAQPSRSYGPSRRATSPAPPPSAETTSAGGNVPPSRPRKLKPTKSIPRAGSGPESATRRASGAGADDVARGGGGVGASADGGALDLSRGSSNAALQASLLLAGAGRSVSGGSSKRQRSRTDLYAVDEDVSSAVGLRGLVQATLSKVDEREEVIKNMKSDNVAKEEMLRRMSTVVEETKLRAQAVETLLETVKQDTRVARDHFNKSHSLMTDELLELRTEVAHCRTRVEPYLDPHDNFFHSLRAKAEDAVGPLQTVLEATEERVQSAAETNEYLKRELSARSGDLAERIARLNEIEFRVAEREAEIRAKDAEIKVLSLAAAEGRHKVDALQMDVERLQQSLESLRADGARKDDDIDLARKTQAQTAQDVVDLQHRLNETEAARTQAQQASTDLAQRLRAAEEKQASLQAAVAKEKDAQLELIKQLNDVRADFDRVSTEAALLRQAKQTLEIAVERAQGDLEKERERVIGLHEAVDQRRDELDALRGELHGLQLNAAQSSEKASSASSAQVVQLASKVEELEDVLNAARAMADEAKARAAMLEKRLQQTTSARDEELTQLQGRLSKQEDAARDERRQSNEEISQLREKNKEILASAEEAILLRSQVKTLQDALAQKATALGDLTTQHTALSGQVQQMDARRKTVADRYRVGELDAAEHTLVKIITRGVQASTQKTQVDLENQLKRAERTIQNLKNEKEVLEKERNKQLARAGSGKMRDLIDPNAMDQSSTPSSVPDKGREAPNSETLRSDLSLEKAPVVLVAESRSNSGNSTEVPRLGGLTALDDQDETSAEGALPGSDDAQADGGTSSHGHRPAATTVKRFAPAPAPTDDQPAPKKLRSAAQADPVPSPLGHPGPSSLGRPVPSSGKTYKKPGGSSRRNR